ncbi:hypothetical protein H0H93_002978 [Arthromyces matolae]|nr:hypothetical protein H0H93_002978 [Arthromyces matolae]
MFEEEVVIEAAGSLRNLCIDGGYDICAEMYNKNILVPWTTFIPKYLDGSATPPENAQNLVYEFADNVITVLWCLSETSNKALDAINKIQLVPFLMSFLGARDKLPLAPVTAAAHCLYVLTDDNAPAISDVRADAGYISCLLDIARSTDLSTTKDMDTIDHQPTLLKVLCSGILRNLSPLPPPTTASFIDVDKDLVLPLLQPLISSVSLFDASANALELITIQNSEPQIEKPSLKGTPGSDHKSKAEIELTRLETRLQTVRLALEILTGVCATLPDPKVEVPEESENEGDDDDAAAMDVGDDMKQEPPNTTTSASFLPTLVVPLLALIQPTSLSFPPLAAPSPHPPTTSALGAIHVAALECLNNIFLSLATQDDSTISSDHEAGRQVWDKIWSALAAVGTETALGQEIRQEVWHIAVGVLWGVGNVWKGSLAPNEEQVQLLIQLCGATSDDQIRVKCIGTLECLAQHPHSIHGNKASSIGTEPLIQATSALIDIYSDEGMPYDVNFRQGGYLLRLANSVEGLKKAVRSVDRRKPGGRDLRLRAEEVRDNLIAFIEPRYGNENYPQAVISKGNVYVSGNIGCTKDFKLVEGGVQPQTRAALENIAVVLKAAGSGLEHIVKVNIYLPNLPRDFASMNEVYLEVRVSRVEDED